MRAEIARAKSDNNFLGALSLDLQDAYDNVNLLKLVEILKSLKLSPFMIKFVINLIDCRNIFPCFGGVEFGREFTNKGLLQGCILSPILFNIYICFIVLIIHPNYFLVAFADDILIFAINSAVMVVISELRCSILRLIPWLNSLNLCLSIPKSNFAIFPNSGQIINAEEFEIVVDFSSLKNVLSFKYLGESFGMFSSNGNYIANTSWIGQIDCLEQCDALPE